MRSLKIALCVSLLPLVVPKPTPAAVPTSTYWHTRPGGSGNNGGGFDSGVTSGCTGGTDRSESDAPFIAIDNVTITASTSGVSPILTLAGYTPSSADKCNAVQVISGTNMTAGIYIITGVSGQDLTLDRNVSSGVGSAVVANMGGSFATIAQGVAQINSSGGDRVYVYNASTYTLTTTLTPPAANASTLNPTRVIGHGASLDDGNQATITTATNSTILWTLANSLRYFTFENFIMSNTAGTRADCVRATVQLTSIAFVHNTFDGCAVEINGDGTTADIYLMVLQNNVFKNAQANAVLTRCGISANNNLFLNNANAGIQDKGCTQGINKSISGNAFYGNQYGYYLANSTNLETYQLIGNGFSGQSISNVRMENSAPMSLEFYNNIVYNGTTYGFDQSAGTTTLTPFVNGPNAFGSNGTARHQVTAGASDIALASCNPFVSASTGNFALSACGKLAVAGFGFPGVSVMGTGVSDLGPLQTGTAGATGICSSSCVQ